MSALEKLGLGRGRGLGAEQSGASAKDMREALLLLRDYEQSGQGWFWSTDAQGRVAYISDCVAKAMGVTGGLTGRPFASLFNLERDQDDAVERTLPLILSGHKTFSGLALRAAIDGDEVWWSISGRPRLVDRAISPAIAAMGPISPSRAAASATHPAWPNTIC